MLPLRHLYMSQAKVPLTPTAYKFQDKEIPDDIPEIGATKNMLLRDILVTAEEVSSNSDFRRLVEGGGVTILPDTKVADVDLKVTNEMVVKVGKKKFFKITLN